MRKSYRDLTNEEFEKVKSLILGGWSIHYSLGLIGIKSSHQEYLNKNSVNYKNLREIYFNRLKGEKNDISKTSITCG